MNVVVLDRGRRVHTRMARFAQDGVYRADCSQPVVEDRGKKQYLAVAKEGETESAVLEGLALLPDKPGRKAVTKNLVISTPGCTLEAEAGEVAVTDAGVVVTVARKPT